MIARKFLLAAACVLIGGCICDRGNVTVGGLSESVYRDTTVRTIVEDGLGSYTVLFRGPWNPSVLEKTLSYCRQNGLMLTMDEVMHRQNRGVKPEYLDSLAQIVQVLNEYPDVVDGTLFMSEFGGVNFSWPASSVAKGNHVMPPVSKYSQAEKFLRDRLQYQMNIADSIGLPRPFCSIEPMPGAISHLLRSGIDRVDVEMIYGEQTERRYACALGASKAFGKERFGVDNAVVWYGGDRHDAMWYSRFRMSLYHAYLRGANPIYAEHGIMDYSAFGRHLTGDDPHVIRFRNILAEFASWVEKHPRPEGYPRAAVAFMQGRLDGYAGGWQTHLWGQRSDEKFRIGDSERAWKMVEECFVREGWESRDKTGDVNYSSNPPLGSVDIIPYDTPDEMLAKYETVVLLGFNSMDDQMYERLIRYVEQGGTLLLTAAHLDCADSPSEGFKAYNNGDWSELTGLKALSESCRMRFGLKFVKDPSCGWKLHQYGKVCDPWFTDGGFQMPKFEFCGAEPIAVGSVRFPDSEYDFGECLLYEHNIGDGSVVFCPSIDPVGAPEVYPLYKYLVRRAFEAVDSYPKVVCGDAVRWSCYDDGTVMLLNTEDVICQEAVVYHDSASFRRVKLAPGELKILDGNVCIKRNRLRERLRKNIENNSVHEEEGCCNLVNSNA